jgi:hypothetical protein
MKIELHKIPIKDVVKDYKFTLQFYTEPEITTII